MPVPLDQRPLDWMTDLRKILDQGSGPTVFSVEALRVRLWATDPALVRWVMVYLGALAKVPSDSDMRHQRIAGVHSDEIVRDALVTLPRCAPGMARPRYSPGVVTRYDVGAQRFVYTDAEEGFVWVLDLPNASLTLVYSSRSRWPAVDYARLVREVVTRHLEDQRWTQYHAGCVLTDQGGILLMGENGAGKTSLLLALLRAGTRYVANERVFLKRHGSSIRALGYPITVGVGLGTAQHFPEVAKFITNPGPLQYPRLRLNLPRVLATPPEHRQYLEDKLDLLVDEVIREFGAAPCSREACISGIVVPSVCKAPTPVRVRPLDADELAGVLSTNVFRRESDVSYPAWLDLPFDEREGNAADMASLPAIKVEFSLEQAKGDNYRTLLRSVLAGLAGTG